jgi:anhydro-N-acetylmuramic acid kinase
VIPIRVAGLLSGTSTDGIDALVLEVEGADPDSVGWRVQAFETLPWDAKLQDRIREAMAPGGADARELAALHVLLGEGFAQALLGLLEGAGIAAETVDAVGSHGQTIWHEPPRRAPGAFRFSSAMRPPWPSARGFPW